MPERIELSIRFAVAIVHPPLISIGSERLQIGLRDPMAAFGDLLFRHGRLLRGLLRGFSFAEWRGRMSYCRFPGVRVLEVHAPEVCRLLCSV